MHERRTAVLLTGVYGTGKSSVAAEMADILERADVPYAAIDLDWLCWANVDDVHGPAPLRVLFRNLSAVLETYRDAGMTHFILAGTIDRAELDEIRRLVGTGLGVVRLTAPIEVIERRLGSDPTAGRRHDLEVARRALDNGVGDDIGDITVNSDRPIAVVAAEILDWLAWPSASTA
jgi:chloramphenicol 3-O-phosphotransferase